MLPNTSPDSRAALLLGDPVLLTSPMSGLMNEKSPPTPGEVGTCPLLLWSHQRTGLGLPLGSQRSLLISAAFTTLHRWVSPSPLSKPERRRRLWFISPLSASAQGLTQAGDLMCWLFVDWIKLPKRAQKLSISCFPCVCSILLMGSNLVHTSHHTEPDPSQSRQASSSRSRELPEDGKVAFRVLSHGPPRFDVICGSIQNHIASFLPSFCFWMEAKWYLGMETCFKTKGGWGNFNGEREVLESLPVRTEMTDDKFLSSGLLVGSTILFFILYHVLPHHGSLGDSQAGDLDQLS